MINLKRKPLRWDTLVLQISCHLADVWMVNRMNTGFKGLVLWYHGHNID